MTAPRGYVPAIDVWRHVARVMNESGKSALDVAREAGVSHQVVYALLRGERKRLQAFTARQLWKVEA